MPRPRGEQQPVLCWFSNNGTQLATGFRVKKRLDLQSQLLHLKQHGLMAFSNLLSVTMTQFPSVFAGISLSVDLPQLLETARNEIRRFYIE